MSIIIYNIIILVDIINVSHKCATIKNDHQRFTTKHLRWSSEIVE